MQDREEYCVNAISSDSTTFRAVTGTCKANLFGTLERFLNYISFRGEMERIVGAELTSPLTPNNTPKEWTFAWCKIPSGTELSAGENFFKFYSSDRSRAFTFSTYVIIVESTGGYTKPFMITAKDGKDIEPGRIEIRIYMPEAFTLTSDLRFAIFIKYPS